MAYPVECTEVSKAPENMHVSPLRYHTERRLEEEAIPVEVVWATKVKMEEAPVGLWACHEEPNP